MWQAFKNVYEHKNKTTLEHDQEAEYEARDLMAEAIKAYVLNDKPKDEEDPSIMIPVHGWIWQNFKEAYAKRNKNSHKTDEDLIENSLTKIVHDWACRAMQYYIREGIEDPWTIMEAYEVALNRPAIRIRRERDTWTIEAAHMFNVVTRDPAKLLRHVKEAKDYIEAAMPKHRTVRDIVREAYAIQGTCPAMIVEDLRHGGWVICFKDNDYSMEVKDGAETLLREVKEAKAYWEALQELEKKERADTKRKAVRLDEDEEERVQEWKDIREEAPVIRLGGLPTTTILLLLHLVETLSFKAVTDILGEHGIADTWDELYIIRQKLKDSLVDPRRKQ